MHLTVDQKGWENFPAFFFFKLDLFNPRYLVPVGFEIQLILDGETEPDTLPYHYDGFWKQYGFDNYDEYLDDHLSWKVSHEEWVKMRYRTLK